MLLTLSKPKVHLAKKTRLSNPRLSDEALDPITEIKALDEYILMVLFVLLLKRVHFLVNET